MKLISSDKSKKAEESKSKDVKESSEKGAISRKALLIEARIVEAIVEKPSSIIVAEPLIETQDVEEPHPEHPAESPEANSSKDQYTEIMIEDDGSQSPDVIIDDEPRYLSLLHPISLFH